MASLVFRNRNGKNRPCRVPGACKQRNGWLLNGWLWSASEMGNLGWRGAVREKFVVGGLRQRMLNSSYLESA